MKKTLAVAAVLAAFAGSAAADVTVYGIVDLGLGWTHDDAGKDSVSMVSGMDSANRVGFKASEKVGNVTVGVHLENSFSGDSGKDGQATQFGYTDKEDSFFNRETRLYVEGAYGSVSFGRFGALDSTTGSQALAGSRIHATTGINGIAKSGTVFLAENARVENAVSYKSPKFAGAQVHAMYATQEGAEFTHKGDNYYALGATYDVGALKATVIASYEDLADEAGVKGEETKAYTAAVSYDFGVTKLMAAAQYFDNVTYEKVAVDGYGVTVGAVTPVLGGSLKTQFGFMKAETLDNVQEFDAYNVGALYYYDFSKRTSVYGGVGLTVKDNGAGDVQTINGALGLIHKF